MLKDLVLANRSYRRFDHTAPVSLNTLKELVELSRLCPSAANKQPLRFFLCTDPEKNSQIFDCLKWAAYLSDWSGPAPDERPTAYIVILNTAKSWEMGKYDQGIVAQTMLLGAAEKGLGGCMIASVDRDRLQGVLALENALDVSLVLALGKPMEEVRIVDLPENGSIKYYRDQAGVHHVPKRGTKELIAGTCGT